MNLRNSSAKSAVAWILGFCLLGAEADTSNSNPPVCQKASGSAVELIDCLQTQQEILQNILAYEKLQLEADELRNQRNEPAPLHPESAPAPSDADDEWNAAMERVNWFDQNLAVYAIVGSAGSRVAYCRLEGRDYSLRAGDRIRLARVILIEPRAVHLELSGVEFAVGLSGPIPVLPAGEPQ